MKTHRRSILIALLVVLLIGLAARYLPANQLRPRIEAALETALNRPVHITGGVHLNLFTGPGFTVENVLIEDDPAAGIEPFAQVESLQARVSLASLLTGKLVFSSLRLGSPSVNLVRIEGGPWNIQPLLDRPLESNATRRHSVPDIQIRDGRLNFKFGDTKSVFFIQAADVDVYPDSSGEVVIRFSGAPARTDQGSQAFGQLSARGLLRPAQGGESQLSIGLHLERTAISELVRLFNGRDLGVHGFTTANAKLAGPLSGLELSGDLNISDVHRWDQMPAQGLGWTLNYRGLLNLPSHELALETFAVTGPAPAVSVKLRLTDYLSSPRWAANILFRDLPVAALLETARRMGAFLPPGVQADGKVLGAIGYSNRAGLQGELALRNASVKFPEGQSAEFEQARVSFSNGRIALVPSELRMDNGQTAQLEGEYAIDNSHAALKITTRQLAIAEVGSSAGIAIAASPVPVLETLRQGAWKGWIAFDRRDDHPGVWSGEYDLQNTVLEIPGFASPVHFTNALVEMKDGQIQINRIRGHLGPVKFEGDYRYDPDAGHPHRLRLNIPELQLADLERLMTPALGRNQGFLERTFRLRNQALPKWLEERQADASIQVGTLWNGDSAIGRVRAHMVWDGPTIVLSDVDCRLDEMHAIGKVSLNLAKGFPAYRLTGSVANLDYRDGQLDIEGELETSGIGTSRLLNLRSVGTFEGRAIGLSPDTEVREITGSYLLAAPSGVPRLSLTNVQVEQGSETLYGQGSSGPDGHIILELASGRKQVRLSGMLLPIHAEPAAIR
jgi:hypothetical protein